jgi:hypothetical protein
MNSVPDNYMSSDGVSEDNSLVFGEFVDFMGERCYAIRNVDRMDPFLISLVSAVDHWLFISSNGGLTAGRISPETALFPYITVDKIHDSVPHTGSKTILRVRVNDTYRFWEPLNGEHDDRYLVSRNLYKNVLGNKLCFEEINHDLRMAFRYTWATSKDYGFVRRCMLQNLDDKPVDVELVDGLQNLLPAGTPAFVQANSSNLVNAYKWSELDASTGLACLTLYAGISDRPEPSESLKATTVFCLGLDGHKVLLSSEQLKNFRAGGTLRHEAHRRGVRGAYLVNSALELAPMDSQRWQIVADVEQTQAEVVELRRGLANPAELGEAIAQSIAAGSGDLARVIARADGFQATAEENVTVHHYANVLFNVLRGGIFDDQYNISARDFGTTIRGFNRDVYERNQDLLNGLPALQNIARLQSIVGNHGDAQLERIACEYLPVTFGRRHGDPSRPWNQFSINVRDEHGNELLSYEGNWRDIFQNWEALLFSYPEFIESVIAKFVNASTVDGYNPYRITKEGIDWEIEELDNPWSNIGYWGDHQIIYLLKFLELSREFHPGRLQQLLRQSIFCYANVPYRIAPFEAQLEDRKRTVRFDEKLADRIEHRVAAMGADGKLLLSSNGEVYQVNLLEKLLVPILCKLSNVVIDGGVWLNTQRPEWNDANNALVGDGLSMVTMYYMRRYVHFLRQLIADETGSFALSQEVHQWLSETAAALAKLRPLLGGKPVSAQQRYASMVELGHAASRYRQTVYQQESFSGTVNQPVAEIRAVLDDAQTLIDHSIGTNRREDGLYNAYNLLDLGTDAVDVGRLHPMLEGQVAALSTGAIGPDEAVALLEALFESEMYCPARCSFMLYPDRQLPKFLAKNIIRAEQIDAIPLLRKMLAAGDARIVLCDADNCYRFNADFTNVADLHTALARLEKDYGKEAEAAREPVQELYEAVFQHKAFTGRSGTMFAFEGLGSIYWHMVSKLLLATIENFFAAADGGATGTTRRQLGRLYYRVREGIGFNKTPAEYGAFPTDPYSHTPRYTGARQPGMTGQVKEEILCRFGELGIRVHRGAVRFQPDLLRAREFVTKTRELRYVDVGGNWQAIAVPAGALAFTWCQVPIVYRLDDDAGATVAIARDDGTELTLPRLELPADESNELFRRSGEIRQITVTFGTDRLFAE